MTEGLVTIVKSGGHGGRIIECDGVRYYDKHEAIEQLQISRGLFDRFFKEGKFPGYRKDNFHPKKIYFPEEVILAMKSGRLEPMYLSK